MPPAEVSARGLARAGVVRAAILLVGALAFLSVFGYLSGSLIYSKILLDNADGALGAAVQDQHSLAPAIRSLKTSFVGGDSGTLTAAQLQKNRDTVNEIVLQAGAAQMQIDSDDQSLRDAGAGLLQDQWLTVISRSSLDKEAGRLRLEYDVLADARTIMADYAQLARFTESLYDVLLDFNAIGAVSQARNLGAIEQDVTKLQADTATAISLDRSPGLPPAVDTLMRLIQAVGNDFSRLLSAGLSGSRSAISAAEAQGRSDIAKIKAFDYAAITTALTAFYSPLVDAYNADVARAAAAA